MSGKLRRSDKYHTRLDFMRDGGGIGYENVEQIIGLVSAYNHLCYICLVK